MAARKAKPKPKPRAKKPAPLTVTVGVERDLAALAKLDASLARSGLAATALALAREMDAPGNSATSRSMCARALLDTMERLLELAPAAEEEDSVDDLSARRDRRRAGGSRAAG